MASAEAAPGVSSGAGLGGDSEAGPPPRSRDAERTALKLLAAREHSRLELARKLTARGFERADVDAALSRLCDGGAVDEGRLAERYASERIDKGFGPLRIRAELLEKGVPEALIDGALAALADAWPERLAAVHDRRFGALPPTDRADYARRGRFLEQRGFPAEAIRRCLRWDD